MFSKIATDHALEQSNAYVKRNGEAVVGLTENPAALLRWMIGGPALSQLIQEFHTALKSDRPSDVVDMCLHHEQTKSVQNTFCKDVSSLVSIIADCENPFMEDSDDLLVLQTKSIVDGAVNETVNNIHTVGLEQFRCFVQERLLEQTKVLTEPNKRNKPPLMPCPNANKS